MAAQNTRMAKITEMMAISMSGSFSFGFTQGVKLRVFFKDHQDTGCEDDSGALPDAKAVQASSVLVQLRSLKFTCFGTNLHQSSLTK